MATCIAIVKMHSPCIAEIVLAQIYSTLCLSIAGALQTLEVDRGDYLRWSFL